MLYPSALTGDRLLHSSAWSRQPQLPQPAASSVRIAISCVLACVLDGIIWGSPGRRQGQGREDLQDEVRAVPRRREGRRSQAGAPPQKKPPATTLVTSATAIASSVCIWRCLRYSRSLYHPAQPLTMWSEAEPHLGSLRPLGRPQVSMSRSPLCTRALMASLPHSAAGHAVHSMRPLQHRWQT